MDPTIVTEIQTELRKCFLRAITFEYLYFEYDLDTDPQDRKIYIVPIDVDSLLRKIDHTIIFLSHRLVRYFIDYNISLVYRGVGVITNNTNANANANALSWYISAWDYNQEILSASENVNLVEVNGRKVPLKNVLLLGTETKSSTYLIAHYVTEIVEIKRALEMCWDLGDRTSTNIQGIECAFYFDPEVQTNKYVYFETARTSLGDDDRPAFNFEWPTYYTTKSGLKDSLYNYISQKDCDASVTYECNHLCDTQRSD